MDTVKILQETKSIQEFSLETFFEDVKKTLEKINEQKGSKFFAVKGNFGVYIFHEGNDWWELLVFTYEDFNYFVKRHGA